jgi:hypothetical protein
MARWGIIDPKGVAMRSSEDMNHMYEEVKASAAGEFAPSTGVRIDATRRRIYVVKNNEEVSLGLTAQQALDLLAFLRSHEQQLRELAAQANDILEHGIPDGDIQEDG